MHNTEDTPELGSNAGFRQLVAALVGAILGQLTGDKSFTMARIVLSFGEEGAGRGRVAEIALIVIFVAAGLVAFVGALTVKRKWARVEEVMLSVFLTIAVAVVVAIFTVFEYSLPPTPSTTNLRPGQPSYFLLWVILLWFGSLVVLPNSGRTFSKLLQKGYGVLAIAAPMAILGLLSGFVIDQLVRNIGCIALSGGESYWENDTAFWVAKPIGINTICGSYIPVTFASLWWRGLGWSKTRAWTCMLGMTTVAAVYAGVFGVYFYDEHAAAWERFLGFSALPVVGSCAVLFSYLAARQQEKTTPPVGWTVSRRFWFLLPFAFAVAYALAAAIGLAPLDGEGGLKRLAVLTLAHGLNGAIIGMSLMATAWLFRRMPESQA
jgi:putative Mn2+ efflux pump MntP